MNKANQHLLILLGLVLLKFILQYFLIAPGYELHRDEYLHLDLGQHLAWGYQSVPPFISWTSWLIDLFGNSVFWVKFFPALFGALTIVVVWKTIELFEGSLFALVLGSFVVLFSSLLRLNILYQPNSFDILCWTAFFFVIIKYFSSEEKKWLFAAAIVFGLGFLNKYNIAFLLLGLFPAVLLSPQRQIFSRKAFYAALVFGFLLILPNLLWQYNNDFPVVTHLKELSETQLAHVERMDFLRSQLLFFFGGLFVIIAGLYGLLKYRLFKKYRLLFWAFFFILAVFLIFKAKPYYAIGLYPIYIAFGAVYLDDILKTGWKRFLRPVAIAAPVVLFIPLYNVAFPNKQPQEFVEHSEKYKKLGLLRWEDGKDHEIPQDFADMLGWKELASKVDSIYETLPNQDETLILTDNYGQAGAINFYTTKKQEAGSFSADYINWFDLNKKYSNLIRIKDHHEEEDELEVTAPYFETAVLADSIENKYSREVGTRIFVFTGAKVDVSQIIEQEIEKVKNDED